MPSQHNSGLFWRSHQDACDNREFDCQAAAAAARYSSLLALRDLLREPVVDLASVCLVLQGDERLRTSILDLAVWPDDSVHTVAESIVQVGIEQLGAWVAGALLACTSRLEIGPG